MSKPRYRLYWNINRFGWECYKYNVRVIRHNGILGPLKDFIQFIKA